MSNLEPIDEKDLDLGSKFGVPAIEGSDAGAVNPVETAPQAVEKSIESEVPKEIISAEKDSTYAKILSKVKSQQTPLPEDDVKKDAAVAVEKQDAESQIQHLVDVATTKGVIHAVKVAKHMEDNYVLDMFHDKLLSDELHDALMKKGLIEEI